MTNKLRLSMFLTPLENKICICAKVSTHENKRSFAQRSQSYKILRIFIQNGHIPEIMTISSLSLEN